MVRAYFQAVNILALLNSVNEMNSVFIIKAKLGLFNVRDE